MTHNHIFLTHTHYITVIGKVNRQFWTFCTKSSPFSLYRRQGADYCIRTHCFFVYGIKNCLALHLIMKCSTRQIAFLSVVGNGVRKLDEVDFFHFCSGKKLVEFNSSGAGISFHILTAVSEKLLLNFVLVSFGITE